MAGDGIAAEGRDNRFELSVHSNAVPEVNYASCTNDDRLPLQMFTKVYKYQSRTASGQATWISIHEKKLLMRGRWLAWKAAMARPLHLLEPKYHFGYLQRSLVNIYKGDKFVGSNLSYLCVTLSKQPLGKVFPSRRILARYVCPQLTVLVCSFAGL